MEPNNKAVLGAPDGAVKFLAAGCTLFLLIVGALYLNFHTRQELYQKPSTIAYATFPTSLQFQSHFSETVEVCPLRIHSYQATPHRFPTFSELVKASCKTPKQLPLSDYLALNDSRPFLTPTGFIFSQSRAGATTASNMLASMGKNLVFADPTPLTQILLNCSFCTDEDKVHFLQSLVQALGRSAYHQHYFIKFPSDVTSEMRIIQEAFPNVPWVFIYREPRSLLAANLETNSSYESVCTSRPLNKENNDDTNTDDDRNGDPKASHMLNRFFLKKCARLLKKQSLAAIEAFHRQGSRGIMLNSASIKEKFPLIIQEFFKVPISAGDKVHLMASARVPSRVENCQPNDPLAMETCWDEYKPKEREISPEAAKIIAASLQEVHDKLITLPQSIDWTAHWGVPDSIWSGYPGGTPPKPDMDISDPELVPLRQLLDEWSPNAHIVPSHRRDIFNGTIARFNFQTQFEQALAYRNAEVPFVLTHVPNVVNISNKWTDSYLKKKFGDFDNPVTVSTSNKFMYYNRNEARKHSTYTPPTRATKMKFSEWLRYVKPVGINDEHYYLLANGPRPKQTHWISQDLEIFEPISSFWMVDPYSNRGINCRFGMPGIIAEAHYDGGRNFIAMLRGAKRYVILPPNMCEKTYLYPRNHPESRHSMVDWSDVDFDYDQYPLFKDAVAAQIVLRAGEVLYLPSFWMHYIISTGTGLSAQCNSRSGDSARFHDALIKCGFYGALSTRPTSMTEKLNHPDCGIFCIFSTTSVFVVVLVCLVAAAFFIWRYIVSTGNYPIYQSKDVRI